MAKSDDGKLDVKLDAHKGMGGGGTGSNPEQLFAAGYAACFIGAMKVVARTQKIQLPSDVSSYSSVDFDPLANGAKDFGTAVAMVVHVPGMNKTQAEQLAHDAHEVCPYSNATRGNIDVNLSVG